MPVQSPTRLPRPGLVERLRRSKTSISNLVTAAVAIAAVSTALAVTPSRAAAVTPAQPQLLAQRGCANCGVVESVVAVQRKAPVQGIAGTPVTAGGLAGGLVGGLVGNQIGHGNGRAAATVLGVAGGAYAGNAIQRNSKKYTAYQMRIRMADGTLRTVEQRTAVAAGSRVMVDHGVVRLRSAQG